MAIKKRIFIILALSALFTAIVQLNLTRDILFSDYWNTRQISGINYYLSLINESSKGNWRLGSPYVLEWRNAPYLNPSLSINAAGLFKKILGLDIKQYAAITGYLAVFSVMALLLTAFAQIFKFHYFGYLAAAAYIFFPRIILWNRTWSPEINFIFLALFLIFYFSNFKFWKREIGLAVSAGLLFYVYPYYWTFALALLAISDFWQFWNQKKNIWNYLYKYLIIALISSWYWVHFWQLNQLPYYQESIVRIGALYSRFPAGLYTQGVLAASLIIFFLFKRYAFSKINLTAVAEGSLDKAAAGLAAGLVVLNQQAITGMQLEFNSHYLPTILVFLVAFWSGSWFIFINQFHRYKKILMAFFGLAVVGLIVNWTYLAIRSYTGDGYIGGKADRVVEWLLENQIQDKVVYAPEDLGDEINLWTNNYLVWNDNQALHLTPTSELIDRYTYFDLTNQSITDHLLERQTAVFGQTFISSMQKDDVVNKIKSRFLGKEFTSAILADYTKYDFGPMYQKRIHPDSATFHEYLKKYSVDYLVYRRKDRESIYKSAPGKIVFEDEDFIIKQSN